MARVAPDITGVVVGGDGPAAERLGLHYLPTGPEWPSNLGWSGWTLPRALTRARAEVLHAPAYTAPLWGRIPVVLTLHDVSYARHPEWYPHQSGRVRQWFYRQSAGRASAVLTDSEFSRREIVSAYALPETHVHVVPLAPADRFAVDVRVRRELVILHVGDLHPRRNLEMLTDVVGALRTLPTLAAVKLVCIGVDRGLGAAVRARAARTGATEWLEHHTAVTDEELARWYQRASVLAYPSRYEGFGLPILEAMASGTPVVASRASSIPEVAGDAAVLLSPDDPAAWRDALVAVLCDPANATRLAAAGIERAAQFSWARTAAATAEVFRRTSGAQRSGKRTTPA